MTSRLLKGRHRTPFALLRGPSLIAGRSMTGSPARARYIRCITRTHYFSPDFYLDFLQEHISSVGGGRSMRKTALEERKRVELRQSFLLYLLSSVSPSGSRYLLPFKHPGTMLDLLPPMTSLWLSDPHNDATRMYCKQLATLWTLARILNSPQSKKRQVYVCVHEQRDIQHDK